MRHSILPMVIIIFFLPNPVIAQCLITGADLSYVNAIEEGSGIYRDENGAIVDPYEFFAQKGTEMVRLRLWHTPENITDSGGNPITSTNLNGVLAAAQRVVSNGMYLKIAIHYGDYFNDPGKQLMPEAWQGTSHTTLLDSIYQYTYHVLEKLHQQNTVPEIVAIGNETTWGFIDESVPTDGWSWPQDAEKFNAGLNAVDDFNSDFGEQVKKAVHFTESTASWLSGLFEDQGISNFDIIGISYYPSFSSEIDLQEIGQLISELSLSTGKEIMIFETGFIWTTSNGDNYGNFLGNNGNVLDYPISPEGQRAFLLDLANVVYENGGSGLFYWEPAWISSEMYDLWGQGSSYENASLFDFQNNNKALPGFDLFDFCVPNATENPSSTLTINVFPNPVVASEIKVEAKISLSLWRLFDVTGKLIQSGEIHISEKEITLSFDNNRKGIFFLHLIFPNNQAVIKKIIF